MYIAAERATPPKAEKKKPDYYQPEVLNKIIRALDDAPTKWKCITYILIDTGCRRGEVMGLKWESLDLKNNIIQEQHYYDRAGSSLHSRNRGF